MKPLLNCRRGHPLTGPDADVTPAKPGQRRKCRRCARLRRAEARVAERKRLPIHRDEIDTLSTLKGIAAAPVKLFPEVNEFYGWFGARAYPGDCLAAIVGEALRDDQPATTPPLFWGRTGGFLLRSLKAIGKDIDAMYFTNALKPAYVGDAENLQLLRDELLNLVVPDRIIALGQVADDRLTAARIPHATVPHPSWFLRFHYAARAEYKTLLRGAFRLQRELDEVESQA